ncbi:Acetyltransferase (GNAT) family protein [Caulifigura coniformis]|uniref:Acetyltransferase (GNAT) family protein n=1 Tax=Caulifigura coniformis TaxID=2527983 RepID=A0A517SDU8_9PLAN|nr:GNAT family N-acetyltransferase [Caulifigura coniformis]QDT54302.1 Acetyltransferase (GNAT) family protein [Caulifigura coniformis]
MSLRLVESRTHVVAVEKGRVTGTIGVLAQPGRVGLVFPPELDRASPAVPGALIDAAIRRLEQAGAAFAQLTLPLEDSPQAELFLQHGFSLLTDAAVLQRSLNSPLPPSARSLQSIRCDPVDDADTLGDLIRRINQGTLDCPELDVLRTPADLLAAHRAHSMNGRARWWRFEDDGNDVGIVLGTTAEDDDAWEILFFGVVPEQRGHGFGRILLTRFLENATGETGLVRAGMDVRNAFVESVYEDRGFVETGRFRVWVHPLAAPA